MPKPKPVMQTAWNVYDDCLDPISSMLERYVTARTVPGSVELPTGQEMSVLLEECKLDFAMAWLRAHFSHEVANEVDQIIKDSFREVKIGTYSNATKFRAGQLRALATAIQREIAQRNN